MRLSFSALLLSCLSAFVLPASAMAQPASPTPEQTFQLYVRAFLHFDMDAARTLNDALRPLHEGRDALDLEAGEALARLFRNGVPAGLLPLPPEGTRNDADPSGEKTAQLGQRVANALYQTLTTTPCTVENTMVHPPESGEEGYMATLAYTCAVPDATGARDAFQALLGGFSFERMSAFTEAYTLALQGSHDKGVRGEFRLSAPSSVGPWYHVHGRDLEKLLSSLMEALTPFQDLIEQDAAKKVPALTGVPACDLLLARHRGCVARRAPDQLPGVDEMAAELKAEAAGKDVEYMSGKCRALRPITEAMCLIP